MRTATIAASTAAALAAVGGIAAVVLRRRRRPLALLPEPAAVARVPARAAADEPISRETRYDEELDEEARRRHEAAERLRSDPLTERLDTGELDP